MPSNFPSFGPALRLLRSRRHLKQTEVSEKSGLTKAMLSAYETGKNTPSLASLMAYLRAVGTDFAELQGALEAVGGDVGLPRSTSGSEVARESLSGLQEVLRELVGPLERVAAAVEKITSEQSEEHDGSLGGNAFSPARGDRH